MDLRDRLARIGGWLRRNGATVAAEAAFNFVGPFLVYDLTKRDLGDVKALMASSIPPIAWSLVEFARRRRIDALSVLVVGGIALSLLAFIGGGGAKFLQLRENLVTGVIALVFLGSAAIGRPLIYELARARMRRQSEAEAARLEGLRDNAGFRRVMTLMTLVWGLGLLFQTAAACALVLTLSIHDYLIVSPIVGYGLSGALILWTFWYARRAQRAGEARRANLSSPPSPQGAEPGPPQEPAVGDLGGPG